jgi:GntR family transcriptional regulator
MDKIDSKNAVPLYKQLYQVILKAIEDGTFRPGDKIPSEEELQKQFGISRVTVRNGLQLLVDDEFLLKIHGKGTFVADGMFPKRGFSGGSGSFTDVCLRMNAKPTTHIVNRALQPAKQSIVEKLGIKPGENIIYIQRLRSVNRVPYILERDYCPLSLDFLLDAKLENTSIFHLIREKLGIVPARFEDHFEVGYASKKDAALLECDPGTALLRIDQLISTKDTRILYYNEQLVCSNRYKYAVRYL